MSLAKIYIHLSVFVYFIHTAEFAEFCEVDYRDAIHHISVRWLSLLAAVDRALKQFPALRSFFMSKGKTILSFKDFST